MPYYLASSGPPSIQGTPEPSAARDGESAARGAGGLLVMESVWFAAHTTALSELILGPVMRGCQRSRPMQGAPASWWPASCIYVT